MVWWRSAFLPLALLLMLWLLTWSALRLLARERLLLRIALLRRLLRLHRLHLLPCVTCYVPSASTPRKICSGRERSRRLPHLAGVEVEVHTRIELDFDRQIRR